MKENNRKRKFNPLQSYLIIAAGALLIIVRFIGDIDEWSMMDILEVGVGGALISYGIFKFN